MNDAIYKICCFDGAYNCVAESDRKSFSVRPIWYILQVHSTSFTCYRKAYWSRSRSFFAHQYFLFKQENINSDETRLQLSLLVNQYYSGKSIKTECRGVFSFMYFKWVTEYMRFDANLRSKIPVFGTGNTWFRLDSMPGLTGSILAWKHPFLVVDYLSAKSTNII